MPSVSRKIASTTDVGGSTAAVDSDVGDDVHLGKPAERDTDARRPGELGEPGILMLAAIRIGIPIDREQRHPRLGDSRGDELEHEERRRVRDMEVVEDEHERCLLGGIPKERRHGVEEAEACALRLEVVQLGDIGEELP